jgi:hypothetical protein
LAGNLPYNLRAFWSCSLMVCVDQKSLDDLASSNSNSSREVDLPLQNRWTGAGSALGIAHQTKQTQACVAVKGWKKIYGWTEVAVLCMDQPQGKCACHNDKRSRNYPFLSLT